jgi:Na+-transporting NADH:ubiquinone oxidoreductase subunit C
MLNRLKSIKFVMLVSFVSSLLLAIIYSSVKPMVDTNIILDKKQSILKSIGVDTSLLSNNEIEIKYKNHIIELVVDNNGNIVKNIDLSDIEWKENKSSGQTNYIVKSEGELLINKYLPIYQSKNPNGYIIPISGKGLWSTLKGYFAVSEDKSSTLGIVFYAHGETPGLGAEIDKAWFQNQFKIDQESIKVNKQKNTLGKPYEVDGITGATVTSDGVTKFLKRDLQRYINFLRVLN